MTIRRKQFPRQAFWRRVDEIMQRAEECDVTVLQEPYWHDEREARAMRIAAAHHADMMAVWEAARKLRDVLSTVR